MRPQIVLNGEWYFKADPEDRGIKEKWYLLKEFENWIKIKIPGCWQALKGYEEYHGIGWFVKRFFMPKIEDKRTFVIFNAVNWRCDVWLNGAYIGSHSGGYEPFEFEITNHVRKGENVLALRVYLPKPEELKETLTGKQSWYSYVGGPWQDVLIELRGRSYISRYIVSANYDERNIIINCEVKDLPKILSNKYFIEAELIDPLGQVYVMRKQLPTLIETDLMKITLSLKLDEIYLWDPSEPKMYELHLKLIKDDEILDSINARLGFRIVEIKNGMIHINGKPFYIMGILDQDFHFNTIYTVPFKALKKKIELIKKMGFSLVRIHLKIPEKQYIELCDKEGILVWEEMPTPEVNTKRARREYLSTLRNMIERGREHPSVIVYSLASEKWGFNLNKDSDRKWLLDLYKIAKALDLSKLVVDYSGGPHILTDINDIHIYPQLPERLEEFKRNLDMVIKSPSVAFHRNAIGPSGIEPILISEIGFWSLPVKPYRRLKGGWGSGRPRGYRERYAKLKFNKIWRSYEELALETQRHAYNLLKLAIEEIRRRERIAGYVITQLNDVFWECNGLLNFDYTEKSGLSLKDISKLNSQILIEAHLTRFAFWTGENVSLSVVCSNVSNRDIKNGNLIWRIGESIEGRMKVDTVKAYSVTKIGEVKTNMPDFDRITKLRFYIELYSDKGDPIAYNEYPIYVIPKDVITELRELGLGVYLRGERLGDISIPHVKMDSLEKWNFIITNSLDEAILKYVKNGGKALVIITKEGSIIVGRRRFSINPLRGGWITGFHYVRRQELVREITNSRIMGVEFLNLLPKKGLLISEEDIDAEITGYFEGWLHNHHTTTLEVEEGLGKLILTSMRFHEGLHDPLTYVILKNLVRI